MIVAENAEKARADAERCIGVGAEFLAVEAARISAHRNINPLTVEQKAKKAVANATRFNNLGSLLSQKAEKVRIETERRNAESSQVVVVRLLDHRHRYAT